MTTEYHFEADDNDAMADLWQEEQNALAEANAKADHDWEMLKEMRDELRAQGFEEEE